MSAFINVLLIAFLVVYITDYSGFPQDGLKPLLNKLFGIGKPTKLLTCSLCQSWWVSLIYLLIAGEFTLLNVAFVALVSSLTPVIYLTICLLRDILETVIGWLYQMFGIG